VFAASAGSEARKAIKEYEASVETSFKKLKGNGALVSGPQV
jgi:hypothetical protein